MDDIETHQYQPSGRRVGSTTEELDQGPVRWNDGCGSTPYNAKTSPILSDIRTKEVSSQFLPRTPLPQDADLLRYLSETDSDCQEDLTRVRLTKGSPDRSHALPGRARRPPDVGLL
jgi:hypothetical protein